jgi:hypothetical protein
VRFRHVFYSLVPSWLKSGDGERLLYSLGLMMDAMAERFRLSYEADLPEYAPEDALAYMGRDRRIRRGINEPADAYAARLIRFLDDHRTQGNPFALMDQLYAYLQTPGVVLRTVDARGNWFSRAADGTRTFVLDSGNWEWDTVAASSWSRFWVIIYSDTGPWTIAATWGAAALWGTGKWGAGATWGTSATVDQVAAVRSIIKEWKPAGTTCEWIVIAFDPASFSPAAPEPSGGDFTNWHKDSAGTSVPARLATARYWRGTEAV